MTNTPETPDDALARALAGQPAEDLPLTDGKYRPTPPTDERGRLVDAMRGRPDETDPLAHRDDPLARALRGEQRSDDDRFGTRKWGDEPGMDA